MQIALVTLFPEMFVALSGYGITGRALDSGLLGLEYWNPRDFTTDKHRSVDDKPFGGGPGMLMKTAPLRAAISAARESLQGSVQTAAEGAEIEHKARVIYLSPQGRKLDQQRVMELAQLPNLVLVCGRYQGIDARLIESDIDEELSLGDFVISGGELAAMVLMDAVIRQLPGALGADESAATDSLVAGLLHCPEYTRPQMVDGQPVPEVLLSGDHEKIRRWRLKQSLGVTRVKRPDLLSRLTLNEEQFGLLAEYLEEQQATQQAQQKLSQDQESSDE